jgi:AbrB family looped-hinge helix DNA binding protein
MSALVKDLIMLNMISMLDIVNLGIEIVGHDKGEGKDREVERVIVKGYMRPDGTSYYVVIPKEIRELMGLRGGEHFVIKAKPDKREIKLKMARLVEEGTQ